MKDSYILEIPDLPYVLKQEEVIHWEVFLQNTSAGYEKIRWRISSAEDCYTLQNVELFYGRLKAVKIDFKNNRIIFYRGAAEHGEFSEFLMQVLQNMFLRVNSNQMHFFVSAQSSKQKESRAMK